MKLFLLIISASALLSGCAAQVYTGLPLGETEAAHLKTCKAQGTGIAAVDRLQIVYVNDVFVANGMFTKQDFTIAPGVNIVEVGFLRSNAFAFKCLHNGLPLVFNAERGHSYEPIFRITGNDIDIWMQDTTTGAKVAVMGETFCYVKRRKELEYGSHAGSYLRLDQVGDRTVEVGTGGMLRVGAGVRTLTFELIGPGGQMQGAYTIKAALEPNFNYGFYFNDAENTVTLRKDDRSEKIPYDLVPTRSASYYLERVSCY